MEPMNAILPLDSGATEATRPVLSIIIVTYASAEEIGNCLASIPRSLDGGAVEVFVVDNASPDLTVQLVRTGFPWVHLIASPVNLGFGKANNLAYEQAAGDFVLFLNPDTVLNAAALGHCLRRLRQEPGIGMISPRLVMADGEMDLASRRSIPTVWDGFCRALGLAARFPRSRWFAGYNLTYLDDRGTYDVGAVNGAFMLCPRTALLRFGAFDEQFFMYGDDLDLCHRCSQAGYRVVYDGTQQIIHLKGMSSSKQAEKMAREVFRGTKQFYRKHFNPHGSRLVALKYAGMFAAWEQLASLKARLKGQRRARPL